jgi:acetyl-CoA carboxylase biotin carboxyl carrier protein
MALSDEDVREILRIIDESRLSELHLTTEGFVLHVLRGGASGDTTASGAAGGPGGVMATAPSAAGGSGRAAEEASVATRAADLDSMDGDGTVTIEAPMLGTFYRAESPGEAPFVEVGSRVEADTTVGIIEVMKMMNSVAAGVAGTIVEVCLENAEVVESGAPLFRVQPDADGETPA